MTKTKEMKTNTVYDIIGIGIGPFNLGLAALADSIPELKCLFVDQETEFNWHPGLMLERARLQVPFFADLVTLADPCSKYSYLAFLKAKQRLFRFAIHENNFTTRKEYNEYCQWVVKQLPNLYFGYRCEAIKFEEAEQLFSVYTRDVRSHSVIVFQCKHIVIGTGTNPSVPGCALDFINDNIRYKGSPVLHSCDYLNFKERLLTKKSLTIIGSGQSAAEIFYDLLQYSSQFSKGLTWFTKSDRFYPMEYSKLTLEMTSPDYIEHFYSLAPEKRNAALSKQNMLYKGINFSLINEIYDELYFQSLSRSNDYIQLGTHSTLTGIKRTLTDDFELQFHHSELEQDFTHLSQAVVLATGYRYYIPEFTDPIKGRIQWTPDRQYQVNLDYSIDAVQRIFVQNAELHTHGFTAPDLGMGPYRNATILNTILGKTHFNMEKNVCFQRFGLPAPLQTSPR